MKYNINAKTFGRDAWPPLLNWVSTDTKENYKPVFPDGTKNLYKPEDIDYRLNNDRFRCDDFYLESELPILFSGCSISEGIGVPVEHTWCYLLLENIRQATGKNIPYWNISVAGSGIDTMARLTYLYSKKLNIKHMFMAMPLIYRREFSALTQSNECWNIPSKFNNATYPYHTSVNELFTDELYAESQTTRSLMIIDSVLASIGSSAYTTSWLQDDSKESTLFNNFPTLNYNRNTILIQSDDVARDNLHPGPIWHRRKADEIWNNVKHRFIN